MVHAVLSICFCEGSLSYCITVTKGAPCGLRIALFPGGNTLALSTKKKRKNKNKSQITPISKGMGLSTRRSGGGGAAQGHPNQSSGARSTTATPGAIIMCCLPQSITRLARLVNIVSIRTADDCVALMRPMHIRSEECASRVCWSPDRNRMRATSHKQPCKRYSSICAILMSDSYLASRLGGLYHEAGKCFVRNRGSSLPSFLVVQRQVTKMFYVTKDAVVGRQTQAGHRAGNHQTHTHRRVTSAPKRRPTTPHNGDQLNTPTHATTINPPTRALYMYQDRTITPLHNTGHKGGARRQAKPQLRPK